MFVLLLSFLICTTPYEKEPILTLSLALSPARDIETTFAIGNSRIRVSVDLNYDSLDVCCKNTNTLAKRIYYFMVNPFQQTEDYSCKSQENGSKENDTATFEQIGPLNINFNQMIYPECSIGRLGFGKASEFLALMPARDRFYVIEQENEPEVKGNHWQLVVGGKIENEFTYVPSIKGEQWRMEVNTVRFNGIPFPNQTLKLISDHYRIAIPSTIYTLVEHELTTNFECVVKNSQIYCPCAGGISPSFPKFKLDISSNFSVNILETSYLDQKEEICSTILQQSESNDWEINILLFNGIDVLFDYDQKRIGFAEHRQSIQKNELINKPVQIILNCAVILVMCFFVAMVLIELIKYLIGIEEASNESFETFMLKRTE